MPAYPGHQESRRPAVPGALRRVLTTTLVLSALAGGDPARGAVPVEFPGPLAVQITGGAETAITVPWDATEPMRILVGTDDGAVTVVRYIAATDAFTTSYRLVLGGRVTSLAPLPNLMGEIDRVAVALVDPDRVVICDLFRSGTPLQVSETIPLEEDPAGMAALGVAGLATEHLAVGLVGLDRIVLLEDGPAGWSIVRTVDSGDGPAHLVGTDLDGDGRDELAVGHVGALSESVSVFLWGGDTLDFVEDRALPASPRDLAAMDREGDGRRELVTISDGTALAHELSWDGASLNIVRDVALTLTGDALAAARRTDGRIGLYVANTERALVESFYTGGGGWERQDSYYPACRPGALVAGEFNRDGNVDLVGLGTATNLLTVLLGSLDGGFWGYPVLSLSGTPAHEAHGDFDGDGRLDVAVVSNFSTDLSIFSGREGGLEVVPENRTLPFLPGALAPLQIDADAALELAVVDRTGQAVRVLDRGPGGDWSTVATTAVSESPTQLEAVDVDGDGLRDILALGPNAPEVEVLFGDGAGGFPTVIMTGFVWQAVDVVAVDLNGDGDRELVATDGFFRVQILENLDGRSFGNEFRVNAAEGAGPLCVGDVDGDLDDDVVVANMIESSLTFLENDGGGALIRKIGSYSVPGMPEGVLMGDINDDGTSDVVLNLRGNGTIGLLLGFGGWIFAPTEEFVVAGDVRYFFADDLNADTIPDILTLDASLNLGLALMNVERITVDAAPEFLTAACDAGDLVVEMRPEGATEWWLDAGAGGTWRPLADRRGAVAGRLDRAGEVWRLVVTADELAAAGLPGPAERLRLRLAGGEGLVEFAIAAPPACSEAAVDPLGWRREPWPNPFNPVLNARFSLARPSQVTAGVYDLQGRLVQRLLTGYRGAGDHDLSWDGKVGGRPGSAGVYLLRIETARGVLSRKVVLLK